MRFMICFAMAATLAAPSARAEGPGLVPDLAPFKAVELRHDGLLDIRHGPVQQVTLVAGDRWPGGFAVTDGRLVIHGCKGCGDRFHVVVVTPAIEALAATGEGGVIAVHPGFSPQAHAALSAAGGGVIRAANLQAEAVMAMVDQGARIEATASGSLVANASGKGEIAYHGQPKVVSNIADGGKVRAAAQVKADGSS